MDVVGFNLVLTVDRYAFVIHLPLSKWELYLKNNKYFFRKLKAMDNIDKWYGKNEKYLEKSGNFFVRKKWEPCLLLIGLWLIWLKLTILSLGTTLCYSIISHVLTVRLL